ncbi:MAG: putative Fe-S cluster assembly protein SufT [Candidatus Neomarinimicrobiota bacterium]|jgi:probable FeS assembly SUF system protein SufT|nr:putative Fe-S cluster assembly protein SufT [Candidatus Neomarinimicrobiota bacterium]|tara:strand:- start:650 stop:1192 length:543 start_codon:yes stop_codon:yes gene_type:complete
MNTNEDNRIRLIRDVEANMVPSGDKVTLVAGNLVQITQSLGGNYTIVINGNMAQISAKNADALGIEVEMPDSDSISSEFSEQLIWDQLKTCYDPEIPVNIVELGLIYDLNIKDGEKGKKIDIKMTLTAPGCGMGPVISDEVDRKINALEDVENVNVELVWEPQWNQGMMSEAAQLELGMF